MQLAMNLRHTVICGMAGCTIFFHISQRARFSKAKNVIENKTRFDFSTNCIVITIIHHELGLDSAVSTSSSRLFTGLPRCLRPFGL
jgi:hypothetical protein